VSLPTIPYDKSLHVNYGVLISAVSLILIAFVLRGLHWPLYIAPPLSALFSGVMGKLKEVWDKEQNQKAAVAGLDPPHTVEVADIRYTFWGGCLVSIPALLLLVLSR